MTTFRGGGDPTQSQQFPSAEQLALAVANAEDAEANAASSAAAAASSASDAATSETNAATSETNAAASYDSFDDRYLGAKASDPTLDNDGDALLTGAIYFNTTTTKMRVWNGGNWDDLASAKLTEYVYTASASQTSFTGSDDNANTLSIPTAYEPVVYLNGIKLKKTTDYTYTTTAVTLISGAALNDVLEVVVLGDYVIQQPVDGTNVLTYTYIATSGQTAFTGADDNANTPTLTSTEEVLGVYVNGVRLRYGASHDYTIDTGTDTVTLNTGATLNDVVDIVVASTFTVTNALTETTADARYLLESNNLSDLDNAATARTNLGVEIGTDVQAYDATILVDADIGVNVQAYDATILNDADIGVNVQAYNSNNAQQSESSTTATTSGSTALVTGLPSWATDVDIILKGVSLSGTDEMTLQLGTSGGLVTTGYTGGIRREGGGTGNWNTYAEVTRGSVNADVWWFTIHLTKADDNKWLIETAHPQSPSGTNGGNRTASGYVDVSGTLERFQLGVTGTDTFDAGAVMWRARGNG